MIIAKLPKIRPLVLLQFILSSLWPETLTAASHSPAFLYLGLWVWLCIHLECCLFLNLCISQPKHLHILPLRTLAIIWSPNTLCFFWIICHSQASLANFGVQGLNLPAPKTLWGQDMCPSGLCIAGAQHSTLHAVGIWCRSFKWILYECLEAPHNFEEYI